MSLFATPQAGGSPLSERPSSLVQVFGMEPFHTDGELLALGFSLDGTLWSVEDPGVLRHWDPALAQQIGWRMLDDLATLWAFSPDARWVAAGSDELSLWEVSGGDAWAVFSPPVWVTSLAFSPDGRWLASGHDDGTIRIWDTAEQRMVRELRNGHHRPISAVAFRPDGTTLASAGEEKTIQLWNLATGAIERSLLGHTDRIPAMVWHPTLPRLYSAGWDTTARVWDTTTGEPIILLNAHASQVHTLVINNSGTYLACADSANAVFVWDLETHRILRVWPDPGSEIRCLAFGPDGATLAAGGSDHLLRLRNIHRDQPARSVPDPLEARCGLALSPDGAKLFNLATGGHLRSWEVRTTRPLPELKQAGPLRAFALSPDGRFLAGSLLQPLPTKPFRRGDPIPITLYLWDNATGQRIREFDGQAPPITALTFSPDGQLLASASHTRSDVWLWKTETGEPFLLIPGALEGCSIEALAFSPNGQLIAAGGIDWMSTGGSDGSVVLWDPFERKELLQFGYGTTALAFHPEGNHLATASLTRSVQIWELPGGELVTELKGHTDAINAIAFLPEGKLLASAGDDHTLRLWDLTTEALLAVTALDTLPRSLAFSPDGSLLYTGNANFSCYQFSVDKLLSEGL